MEKTITLVATAAFGLESVVRRECEAMGFAPHVEEGHLSFEASLRDIARCNMCLRSAERVFVEIGQFSATSFAAFFDAIEALPWPDWMDATARFPVQAASYRSQLASVSDLQRLAKKAIAKRLGRAYGYEILPETGAMYAVHCRLRKDVCRVLLDTSGAPLFQRGYRADRGRAPLKETLAHGLVALSVWTPDRMLVDPFVAPVPF